MLKKPVAICLLLLACVLLSAAGWKTDAEMLRQRNAKTLDSFASTDLILLEDGTVLSGRGVLFDGETDFVSVSASEVYAVALRSDGTVAVHFDGFDAGDYLSAWTDIVDVCANFQYCTLGLKSDGSIVCETEYTGDPLFQEVREWKDVVSLESCFFVVAGLHSDGTVTAVRCGDGGAVFDLSDWTDIVQIAVSGYCVYGLRADGRVLAAGTNTGFPGIDDWTDVIGIFPALHTPIALRRDGTLLVLDNSLNLDHLRTWDNMAAVAPSGGYGAHTDGTLVVWHYYYKVPPADAKARLPWLPLA